MRREIIVFLIILSVFFAAGCAEDEGSEDSEPSTSAEEVDNIEITEVEGNVTRVQSEIIDIEIRNYRYIPESPTVKVGQTVRWTNYDSVPHDVVGSGIESEYLEKGDTFIYTFEKAGTYEYICTIHPWMNGKVIAEA